MICFSPTTPILLHYEFFPKNFRKKNQKKMKSKKKSRKNEKKNCQKNFRQKCPKNGERSKSKKNTNK